MGMIKVKLGDGRIGNLDESQFDPQTMQRLDVPMPTVSPQVPSQGQLQQLPFLQGQTSNQSVNIPQASQTPGKITPEMMGKIFLAQATGQISSKAAASIKAAYDSQEALNKSINTPVEQLANVKAQQELNDINSGNPTLSAADKKNQQSLTAIQNVINNLEQHYQQAGGGETNLGPLTRILGIKKNIESSVGLNENANVYNREKAGFAATLKSLTGDTGVLTDQDYQRLAGLLPGLGSTSKEAPALLNDLRSQVAAKFGGQTSETTFKPKEKNIVEALFPAIAALPQKAVELTNKQSARTPIKPGDLMEALKRAGSDTADLFGAAIPAGIEAGSAYGDVVGAKAAISGVKALPKILSLGSGAKTARTGLIEGADKAGKAIDGTKIAEHFTNWGDQAIKGNPGKEKQVERIVSSVINSFDGKKITPDQAMKLWLDADNGFNSQGAVKTALESKVDVQMRQVLRPLLEDVAPGFDKATKAMAKGIQNKKIAKFLAGSAGSAVAGGLSYAVLGKILGQKSQ